jgi:hypothetical protein
VENVKTMQEKGAKLNPKVLQEAQEECNALKYEYEKSGFETMSKLKDTNAKCDFELLEKVIDLFD